MITHWSFKVKYKIMGAPGFDRVGRMDSASRASWNYHVNLFPEHLTANDADYGLALAA